MVNKSYNKRLYTLALAQRSEESIQVDVTDYNHLIK